MNINVSEDTMALILAALTDRARLVNHNLEVANKRADEEHKKRWESIQEIDELTAKIHRMEEAQKRKAKKNETEASPTETEGSDTAAP